MTTRRLLLAVALLMLGLVLAAGLNTEREHRDAAHAAPEGPACPGSDGGRHARSRSRRARSGSSPGWATSSVLAGRRPRARHRRRSGLRRRRRPSTRTRPRCFEFVAERPGLFPVRFTSDGRLAGVIVVRRAGRRPLARPGGRPPARRARSPATCRCPHTTGSWTSLRSPPRVEITLPVPRQGGHG